MKEEEKGPKREREIFLFVGSSVKGQAKLSVHVFFSLEGTQDSTVLV